MVEFKKLNNTDNNESELLKTLYQEGFPMDTNKDVDYFFNQYFNEVVVNSDYSAALYPIYKTMNYGNSIVELPYIVAFGALKRVRGGMAAAEVMNTYLNYLCNAGVPFVALSPFNYQYYKRYGFTSIDSAISYTDCDKFECLKVQNKAEYIPIMHEIYCKAMSIYDNYLLRSEYDCGVVCDKLLTNGGNMLLYVGKEDWENRAEQTLTNEYDYVVANINGAKAKIYGYSLESINETFETIMCAKKQHENCTDENVQMRVCNPVEAVRVTRFFGNELSGTSMYSENSFQIIIELCDRILGNKNYLFTVNRGNGQLVTTEDNAELKISIDQFTEFLVNGKKVEGLPHDIIANKKSFFIDKY